MVHESLTEAQMDRFSEHIGDMKRRNPFILPDTESGRYYLYYSLEKLNEDDSGTVFVQTSRDLILWSAPERAFAAEAEFRGNPVIRSPKVFFWRGAYYLAASFRYESTYWSCQCFRASSPQGPFRSMGGPLTPPDDSAADGALFPDVRGRPWLIYAKQCPSPQDDEICAILLTDGLSEPAGEEVVLAHASNAPWSQACLSEDGRHWRNIARSPFLHRGADGSLLLLWCGNSSIGSSIGCARSASGDLSGPWIQDDDPLYAMDGGGVSLFRGLDGKLMMALHSPEEEGFERILLFEMEERETGLGIVNEITGNWYPKAYHEDGTAKVAKP